MMFADRAVREAAVGRDAEAYAETTFRAAPGRPMTLSSPM